MRHLNHWTPRLFISLIIILPLLLFWRWLFRGEVLFWGTLLLQFWPWHSLVKASTLAGEWPLWNPLLGNGTPLLANLQTAFFYPPNLLYLLLPVEQGLTLSVIIHLVLAGLLMYRYTRHMGLAPFAATLSALTYMFSGYLVGRTQFVTMVNAAAWLPLLLLLSEKIATRPAGLNILGLALALAVQLLAGHAQLWFYSLWLVGGYTIFRSWQEAKGQPGPALGRAGWRLVAAVGLAVLLAAGQLLPTAEFAAQSLRGSGAEQTFALTYSFWPWRLITLLAPDFFGNPAAGNYWGYANYWEDHAYLGVLPFVLALAAIWTYYSRSRRRQPEAIDPPVPLLKVVPFFAVLVPLSLILAMGWNTPVYLWVFKTVPGFSFFQAPARLLIWYTLAMAVLAGLGAQFFEIAPLSRRPWQRLLVACIGLAGAAGAASFVLTGRSRTFLTATLTLGLLLTFAIILWLRRPRPALSASAGNMAWQWLVIAFVAFDLLKAALPLNPMLPAAIFNSNIASAVFLKVQPDNYRLLVEDKFDYEVKFYRYFQFKTFGPPELTYWQSLKETLIPDLGVYAGLPASNNFDPLVVQRWQRLMDLVKGANKDQRVRLASLMNAGYFITGAGSQPAIYSDGIMAIEQIPRPLPRAYFVRQAYPAADETAAIARLTSPDFDSRQEVIIMVNSTDLTNQISGILPGSNGPAGQQPGQSTAASAGAGGPAMEAGPVTVAEQGSGLVSLAVNAPAAGFVVLTDTFYPGWQVTVDGQPSQIWPANLAFRAVAIEAGSHEVVFRYRPRSFTVGLWVSLATLLAITLLASFIILHRTDS